MISRLKQAIEDRYHISLSNDWSQIIDGGDECVIYRVETKKEPIIVRICPAWRTIAELQWVHRFTLHCAASIPEVVSPIADRHGSTIFLFGEQPVSLFPFIEGQPLEEGNDELSHHAARLLSRIHRAALGWKHDWNRPALKPSAPESIQHDPPELVDFELDEWHRTLPGTLTVGPIHGDYYSRNVLCQNGQIRGIIDWDESHLAPLMEEIGWCAWEFSQIETGDDLNDERARAFLAAYYNENAPIQKIELETTIPFIRWRLRQNHVERWHLPGRARIGIKNILSSKSAPSSG